MTSWTNQLKHYGGIIRHGTINRLARSSLILLFLLALVFQSNVFAQKQGNELVLIDKSLPDLNVLLNSLKPGIKVDYFDEKIDMISSINKSLEANQPVNTLHVVTHGAEGSIFTTSDMIDLKKIYSKSSEIGNWKKFFQQNAEILLYGCLTGKGDAGVKFCEAISNLTSAKVAASSNLTGSKSGDWNLEEQTAEITSGICFNDNISTYRFNLAKVYVHTGATLNSYGTTVNNYYNSLSGLGHSSTIGVDNATTIPDLSTYSMAFINNPDRAINATEINNLKALINRGGRVVFVGEHSGFSAQNTAVTNAVIAMGGHLSIQSLMLDGSTTYLPNTNFNTSSPLMEGVNKLWGSAASAINIGGDATVLNISVTDPTKIVMAQERLGLGDIVAWADVNFWDKINDATWGTGRFFKNLLENSAANITSNTVATLNTTEAYSVGSSSAWSGGNLIDDKGSTITQRGICWSTATASPTVSDTKLIDGSGGTGAYALKMTGLSLNTKYYVRAYAINGIGTAYGNTIAFTTPSIVNTAPTAVADVFSCPRNGTITGNVMSNDFDDDGDPMTATKVINASYNSGAFTLNSNGTFTYTNNGNAAVSDFFTYYLSDGKSNSGTVGVSISIYTPTTPPTGGNGSITTNTSGLYGFKTTDFTYNSSSGSAFNGINVITLPAKGVLKYNGLAISAGATCNDVTKLTYDQNGLTGTNPYTTFTFKVLDMTGQPSTSSYTMTINSGLTPPNSAPVLYNEGSPKLTDQVQNDLTPTGTLISSIIASSTANGGNMITDADAGNPEGIAIVSAETLNGGWQYTINGGTTWLDLGTVSATNARLLGVDANTKLRFVPAAGFIGTANITIRAWDQFTGSNGGTADVSTNGGNSAFSTATETVSVTLIPANNPTVLTLTPTTRDFYENDLNFSIDPDMTVTDAENDNLDGAVVTILNNFNAAEDRLIYTTINGITGVIDDANGVIRLSGSATPAQYQAAIRSIKYQNLSENPTEVTKTVAVSLGTNIYNFENGHFYQVISGTRTWDAANTHAGTQYYLGRKGYLATITSLSERLFIGDKVLDTQAWIGATWDDGVANKCFRWAAGPEGLENNGQGQAFWKTGLVPIGAQGNYTFTDPYTGTSVSRYNYWHSAEPNLSGGPTGRVWMGYLTAEVWDDVPAASTQPNYIIEYGGFTGEATFTTAGSVTFNVHRVNDAPVLVTGGNPTIAAPVNTTGTLVSAIISSSTANGNNMITDVDLSAVEGIAITASAGTDGFWEYTINGTNWLPLGTPTATEARLLAPDANTRVRFTPGAVYPGNATIAFRAWDQSTGTNGGTANISTNGGTTAFSSNSETAIVVKAAQTITFAALPTKVYGNADFAPGATASSSLTVSYSSSNEAVATIVGGQIHIVGGGICTITASQAGNGVYNAATSVNQTLNVSKAAQTITFAALPAKIYGDGDFAPGATASSTLSVSYLSSNTAVATIVAGQIHIVGFGTSIITASQAGNDNFNSATSVQQTLSVSKKTLTAAIIGNPTKNYDGNTNATLSFANYSLTGLVSPETFTVTKTTGTYASATAGPRNVTVSLASGDFTPANGAVAANYTLPTTATGSGTINQATPVVQTNPSATSIVTGQALNSSTLSGGVVTGAGGVAIPGTFSFVTPTVIPPGGNYIATVIFTPTDGTNYTTITFTITVDVKHITSFAAGTHGALSGTLTQNISQNGSSTAITATADAGYKFDSWTINSGSGNATVNLTANPLTITDVTGPINLTANFIVDPSQTFAVTVTAGANGALGGNYNGNYAVETPISITAVPNAGYMFNGWTGNTSVLANPNSATTTLTVTASPANLTANFIVDPSQTFAVTVSAGANGTLGANYNGNYAVETQIPITAIANAGYMFNGWTGNTSVLANPNSATTTLTVTANPANLTANFIVDPSQTFAVTVTAGANGTLGANYNGNYAVETPISITAVSNAGYIFNGWTGNTSVLANPNSATTTLTVTAAAANLTANFIVDPSQTFAVTVTAGANGTLGANYNGNYAVETQIPITAVPNAGYMFNGWTGNTSVLANPNSATTTLTVTAAAVNLTANFIVDPSQTYAVTVTAGANGTLGANYNGNYAVETPISITAIPNTGYMFNGWTGNTSVLANPNSATTTLTVTAAAANLTANFIVDPSQTFALNLTLGAHGTSVTGAGNYNVEHVQTITAVAATGYRFKNWTGDVAHVANVNSATTTVTQPASTVNLTANFEIDYGQTFALTATAGANGSLAANYNGNYNTGSQVTLTAVPAVGYKFLNWTGNVSTLSSTTTATATLTMPAQNVNLTANFVVENEQLFALDLTLGAGGTAVIGAGNYPVTYQQQILATAATGYKFKNWTGDVAVITTGTANDAAVTVTMPAQATALTANFEVDPTQLYSLSVLSNNTQFGTASDLTNTAPYNVNTIVNIKAVPKTGYRFTGWVSSNGGTFGNATTAETTFEMPAKAVILTASFEVDPAQLFALTVSADANGTLGANYNGNYTVGTQMNLTAIPNTGYKFLNWTGDVAYIGNNSKSTTVTLTMPAAAVNLVANFVPETSTLFALNTTIGAGGASVTGAGSYPVDHQQQLVAHAAIGYKFKTWTGDTEHIITGLATDAIVTVKMPAAVVNLTATFEIDPAQAYTLSLVSANLQMGTVIDETATGPYTLGSVVNIKAVPTAGHRFTGWVSSNGGTIGNDFSAATTFTMPANNVLLTAGFEVDDGQTFALNVSAAPHGSLAANYNGYYHVETVKNISAAGDTGYRFKEWTGDVANISAGTITDSAVTVTMPATAVALVAGFEVDPNQFFALNLTLGAHGTSVTGAGNYNVEHVQTITAIAATGYKFANWTGDVTNVADVNSATTTITMPAGAVNLTANFIVDQTQTFALNLTLGAHGASVTGAGSYNVEHIQTITAVAATGYKFANWTGDVTNVADVNSATTTITMPASTVNLTANFIVDQAQTFALNLTLGAHGTSVTGTGNYYAEHIQTITAVATTGYKFANWTGDVTNVANVNSATTTITMPASAVNLTANFVVDQTQTFALNLTLGAHGTSVSGAGNYNAEHVQAITAVAATGYKFANWTGDVTNVANVNSATTTITMPASAVNLTANFIVDEAQTFALSLAANPAAYGNASLASGQAAGPYNAGTVVNVKAVANTGFKFVNWTKPDKEIFAAANKNSAQKNREVVSTLPEFGYTMTAANTALTSNFKVDSAQTFALNITMSTGGQSVTGAGSYVVLHQQSITAVAAAGYQFKNWTGDISAVANANSATTTVTMPSAIVNLTATFEMIVPILAVSADNLNYGNVYIGAEPVQTLKIYNAGASTLVGSIAEVSSPFSFVQTKNNRIKARMQKNRLSFELGMTDTLRLNVKFKPQDINSFLETMFVTSNGSGISEKSVILQGSATADPNSEPVLTLWPDSLIYGSMLVNTSREKKFTLKNNGGKVLTGYIRFPVEHQSVYFSTAKNNSKAGRAILDSVAFSLTSGSVATYASLFTPDSARNYLENISVLSNDLTATGRRNIKVTATGLANGVTLSKNLIDFGKVRVGVAKDSTIMVKNNTAEPFVIYGIKGMNYGTTAAFTSANSSDTITIAANDSAAVNFRFKPQFPTAYRDTAKVFYNAEMTKYLPVYLAGTGEYTGIANGSALVIKPMVVDYGIIANDNLYKGHFTVKNQDIDSTVVGFSLNFDNKYIRVIEQGAIAKASKKGGKDYYFYYLHNGDSINFEVQLTMNSFAAAQITGEQFLSKVWLYSNATSNPNQFVTLKGRTGAVEPGLSAFSLLTPADNHKPYANNIDLSWQSAKNASISGDVEYTAYIITPTDSIALPTTATTVNSGKQLKFNQKYEWTVKAKYGYQEKWANEKWSFELQQKGDATPNPFTPDSRDPNFATTKFDLFDKEADLSVKIYSIGGKFISHVTLIKQIDRWTASWDGKNRNGDIVGPGVYLYQVYTGNKVLRNGFIGVVR